MVQVVDLVVSVSEGGGDCGVPRRVLMIFGLTPEPRRPGLSATTMTAKASGGSSIHQWAFFALSASPGARSGRWCRPSPIESITDPRHAGGWRPGHHGGDGDAPPDVPDPAPRTPGRLRRPRALARPRRAAVHGTGPRAGRCGCGPCRPGRPAAAGPGYGARRCARPTWAGRGDRRHRRILAVIGMSVWATRRRVSYGTWHAIHLLTYGAVALSFVHELVGPTSPPGRCCRCCGR
jgi:hypothetical protein